MRVAKVGRKCPSISVTESLIQPDANADAGAERSRRRAGDAQPPFVSCSAVPPAARRRRQSRSFDPRDDVPDGRVDFMPEQIEVSRPASSTSRCSVAGWAPAVVNLLRPSRPSTSAADPPNFPASPRQRHRWYRSTLLSKLWQAVAVGCGQRGPPAALHQWQSEGPN